MLKFMYRTVYTDPTRVLASKHPQFRAGRNCTIAEYLVEDRVQAVVCGPISETVDAGFMDILIRLGARCGRS